MINPHAFPSPGVVIDYNRDQHQQGAYEGMSLRDYLAAKAMQAMLTRHPSTSAKLTAMEAYALADAMLAERSK